MRYRPLGETGISVSTVSLGSWLTYGGTVEEEAARRCIDRAYELGVNFFDTANVYARGRAERVVGRSLAAYPRSSYVLGTKVYFPMGEGPDDRGLSRKHVLEQCEASLERLAVDVIDLYQCHRFDPETPLAETCEVMDELVRRGRIRHWGVSEWTAAQIRQARDLCDERGWAPPATDQPEYNALQRRIEADVLPTCAALGMGVVVWSPLAQGVLTGKYRTAARVPSDSRAAGPAGGFMGRYLVPEIVAAVAALEPVAAEAGCTMVQLALAWCLRRPEVTSVIVGATRTAQVEDNAAAADLDLPAEVLERVDALLEPVAVEPI